MRKFFLSVLFLAVVAFAQQALAPVEVTAEPHHHLALENMFVRVFAVQVDPGQSTLLHRHGRDYLSIAIDDAQIMNAREGAQPAPVTFKQGDTRFTPAGLVHLITNTGSKPFLNSTIELLQPTTNQKTCTESCSVPVPCDSADKSACTSVTKLIASDQWSVTLINVPAGATYPQHTHLANFLVVPLTDSDAAIKNQDQPETAMHLKQNQATWNNPVVHTVKNTGKTAAKSIVLEFRGRPAGEGSESMGPKDAPKPHDHN